MFKRKSKPDPVDESASTDISPSVLSKCLSDEVEGLLVKPPTSQIHSVPDVEERQGADGTDAPATTEEKRECADMANGCFGPAQSGSETGCFGERENITSYLYQTVFGEWSPTDGNKIGTNNPSELDVSGEDTAGKADPASRVRSSITGDAELLDDDLTKDRENVGEDLKENVDKAAETDSKEVNQPEADTHESALTPSVKESGSAGSVKESGSVGSVKASGSAGSIKASGSAGSIKASGSAGSIKASGSAGSIKESASAGSVKKSASAGSVKKSASAGSVKESASAGSAKESASVPEVDGPATKESTPVQATDAPASEESISTPAAKESTPAPAVDAPASEESISAPAAEDSSSAPAEKDSLPASAEEKELATDAVEPNTNTGEKKSNPAKEDKKPRMFVRRAWYKVKAVSPPVKVEAKSSDAAPDAQHENDEVGKSPEPLAEDTLPSPAAGEVKSKSDEGEAKSAPAKKGRRLHIKHAWQKVRLASPKKTRSKEDVAAKSPDTNPDNEHKDAEVSNAPEPLAEQATSEEFKTAGDAGPATKKAARPRRAWPKIRAATPAKSSPEGVESKSPDAAPEDAEVAKPSPEGVESKSPDAAPEEAEVAKPSPEGVESKSPDDAEVAKSPKPQKGGGMWRFFSMLRVKASAGLLRKVAKTTKDKSLLKASSPQEPDLKASSKESSVSSKESSVAAAAAPEKPVVESVVSKDSEVESEAVPTGKAVEMESD